MLLGFAVVAGVLPNDLAQILIAGVALTMALTPFIMVVEGKIIHPRFGTKESAAREPDAMD